MESKFIHQTGGGGVSGRGVRMQTVVRGFADVSVMLEYRLIK